MGAAAVPRAVLGGGCPRAVPIPLCARIPFLLVRSKHHGLLNRGAMLHVPLGHTYPA